MRDGKEYHRMNKRVRIEKDAEERALFRVAVGTPGLTCWITVAHRGNLKQARIVRDALAALVEYAS